MEIGIEAEGRAVERAGLGRLAAELWAPRVDPGVNAGCIAGSLPAGRASRPAASQPRGVGRCGAGIRRLVRASGSDRWIGHKIDPSMSAVSPGPPVWVQSAEILRSSAAYRRLRDRRGAAVRLPIPAAAWVVELLRAELRRPALVLVPHEADVAAWLEAVRLFSGDGSDAPADGGDSAIEFPSPSLSPYQETDAALPVLAAESAALERLHSVGPRAMEPATVVCTPRALFRRLPTARLENATTIEIRAGSEAFQEEFLLKLVAAGYRREDLVLDVGSFAARGGVVDVFPAGAAQPLRFDWFGDTVESIRAFDPDSQRSLEAQDSARLPPLLAVSGGQRDRRTVSPTSCCAFDRRRRRRQRRRSRQGEGPANRRAVSRLAQLPAFDRRRNDLAPRLAPGAPRGDGRSGGSRGRGPRPRRASARRSRSAARPRPVVGPARCAGAAAPFRARRARSRRDRDRRPVARLRRRRRLLRTGDRRSARSVAPFPARGRDRPRARRTAGGGVAANQSFAPARVARGPRQPRRSRIRGRRAAARVPSACRRSGGLRRRSAARADGPPGASSGRSQEPQEPPANLRRRTARSQDRRLRRPRRSRHRAVHRPAPDGRRVLGVARCERRARRTPADPRGGQGGGGGRPRGHGDRLRRRQAAAAAALSASTCCRSTAASKVSRRGSISSAARRGTRPRRGSRRACATWRRSCSSSTPRARWRGRRPCRPTPTPCASSRLAFPYDETPDQLEAIVAIREDLERERPMDRLLCGDVGYGKTEVAMRAAFKAVDGGYQVAILCPTTILADQHWSTFRRRFAGFPIEIEMVSRFRSAEEVRAGQGASERRARRHPDRHPSAAVAGHRDEAPRPPGDRRGAALRGGAEGAAQAVEEAAPRAGDVRHAGAAHPAVLARRRARPVGDRDPAQGPHGGRDRDAAVLGRRGARGDRVRARARRTDLLRPHRVESIERLQTWLSRDGPRPPGHRRPRPARREASSRGGCTPSPPANTTCCSPPRSSRTASTSRTSTP